MSTLRRLTTRGCAFPAGTAMAALPAPAMGRMTRHIGSAGRRVSLRSTMTRQPRTAPRPEPVLATSAGWPPEGSAARAGWDRLVAVIHRHPLLTDVALAAIRRNPLLADAAVAAAVLALSVPQVITPAGGILVPALVLYTAQAVLLVFRRQYPFGVFWLIFVLVVVTADLSTEGLNGIALLVAFYTVAAYKPLRDVVLAAVTLEAWAVLITFTSAASRNRSGRRRSWPSPP